MMGNYYNAKAASACYRGCRFDSLLELKFAVSLECTHDFLREHVKIYYDPKTKKSTSYLREDTRCYTPDFLIRNIIDDTATLIEIKLKGVCTSEHLLELETIATDYIRQNAYDWKLKIVSSEDIQLSVWQQEKFKMLIENKAAFAEMLDFIKMDKSSRRGGKRYFNKYPHFDQRLRSVKQYIEFVIGSKMGSRA